MGELDSERVGDYFSREGTVARWWTPDEGPLAFHYDAELLVLDEQVSTCADERVLDVGTGRGRFGVHFARRGCRVEAVDKNPEMLEIARETAREAGVAGRFEARAGDATDLSRFADGAFDLVLCMELFDHLPDLEAALREMRRVLAPDGRFAFTYVPSESLYGRLGNVYRALRRRRELVISRTYALREVEAALGRSGLSLESCWGIGVLCVNAQTRLFSESLALRVLLAVARAEARRWPYHARPWLARRGAHVVGLARPASEAPGAAGGREDA